MKSLGESKLLLIMGLIVLLGGGALFGLSALQSGSGNTPEGQSHAPEAISEATFNKLTKDARNVHGTSDAPVTIVEFADFQCPSCRRAFNGEKEQGGPVQELKKKPVRFVFRHLPLTEMHDRAMPAAVAVEAAARQGKFWPMYDALFTGNKAELTEAFFDQCARKAGLNMDTFHKDQADKALLEVVRADQKIADENQITSTPTFVVRDAGGKFHAVTGGIELAKLMQTLKL